MSYTLDSKNRNIIYTIGHSTHAIETFVELLQESDIECLADVRRFPTSKKHLQFTIENLSGSLQAAEIKYRWLGEQLGGFRTGGYEAFMESETFLSGVEELKVFANEMPTAIMCAERLYLKCHRRFIADKLIEDGWRVIHILDHSKVTGHQGALL